ncbi:MAG: hypothetical protein Rpha_0712 [Candidatus Ruthia sp. Apha_13_S6]|nr:hypothetical protein [Candidatus Ruthia sp. Apha_13_S6]
MCNLLKNYEPIKQDFSYFYNQRANKLLKELSELEKRMSVNAFFYVG